MARFTLEDLGWSDFFAPHFEPYRAKGWQPARLIRDNKISYGALLDDGAGGYDELEVILSGKVYHDAATDAELPAVGDWVALEVGKDGAEHVIRARLPRRTCFSRKAAGNSTEEQVIAANVDAVIVVTDAVTDFNPRRMERYFTLIGRSGARAVVLVNKADLCSAAECEQAAQTLRDMQPGAEVLITSVLKRKGIKEVRKIFQRGQTVAVIGSSGVGKSALVNLLLGDDYQWVDEVNEKTGRGRHTTTARELLVLEKGGILIDNPGIKEVQMWTDETTLREPFADIEQITGQCRFHDCKHGPDAGCAIRAAVEAGKLEKARYDAFLKLDEEIADLRRKRKKRQMTVERVFKRDHKIKARNREDRREIESDLKPNRR
ncbi:MAG: ribosome small subunit-dependent GTPase A [Verrucomicrobiaceae bacterium]|nr:ribosome small subunit-dependent GTPase A [Verrucomicrobiaceae bacterium]